MNAQCDKLASVVDCLLQTIGIIRHAVEIHTVCMQGVTVYIRTTSRRPSQWMRSNKSKCLGGRKYLLTQLKYVACFLTLLFHKEVQHMQGVVGFLITTLMQI